jgi:heme oxygenase
MNHLARSKKKEKITITNCQKKNIRNCPKIQSFEEKKLLEQAIVRKLFVVSGDARIKGGV